MNKELIQKGLQEFREQAKIVSTSYGGANSVGLPVCCGVWRDTVPDQ